MLDPLDLHKVRDAYDTLAEDHANHLPDTRAEAPIDLALIDAFIDSVTSMDDARVLDAGCGTGRMSRYLAERGCRVEGIDVAPNMIAMARRDHPHLSFAVGSLTDLPYADDESGPVSGHNAVAVPLLLIGSPRECSRRRVARWQRR